MNDLNKELAELRTYVKVLREERALSEQGEVWTRWVTLSIVFLAVSAALAFQQYGNFSARGQRRLNYAAIEQGKANDQWGYYQAVSVKLHLYRFEKGRVGDPKVAGAIALGKFVDAKIAKYERQKKEIFAKARAFEAERDKHRRTSEQAQRHTAELTLALAVLQVAIAVASIALLSRKKPLWFMSLAIGAFGLFQTFNGMFLWF